MIGAARRSAQHTRLSIRWFSGFGARGARGGEASDILGIGGGALSVAAITNLPRELAKRDFLRSCGDGLRAHRQTHVVVFLGGAWLLNPPTRDADPIRHCVKFFA